MKFKWGDFVGNPASLQKTLKKSVTSKAKVVTTLSEEAKKLHEYIPGKTISEIHKNIKEFTGMKKVDLEGIPLEICQSIEEKYYQIFKKFPELKGSFAGLGQQNLGSRTYAACYTYERRGFN